jgi:hypothetical protein
MSPAEFIWIEDLVYRNWIDRVEVAIETSAVTKTLRETTEADTQALAALEARFGPSRATHEFAARLNQRLESLDHPSPPILDDVPEANASLFWEHREELVALDLAAYSELHDFLRGGNDVIVNIEDEGD